MPTQFWKRTTQESSWIQEGADGLNYERGPPKDHFSKFWNQDGHQAKNRKRGDEIIPLEMHFFVDSLLLVTQIIKGRQLYYKM
jgi:hypothetical protein